MTNLDVSSSSAVLWIAALAVAGILAVFVVYVWRVRRPLPLRSVQGSRIAVAIGEKFVPSDRFSGFVHEESGSSVVLMELPAAAYDRFCDLGETRAMFELQGVIGITQRTLPARKGEYIYLVGEQRTALVDYAKYMLIFRQKEATAVVTVNIPRAALASGLITGTEIESILASAEVREGAPSEKKLFTLDYTGGFEEDFSLLGTTKGYRYAGRAGALGPQAAGPQPIFLVAPSLTNTPIPDLSLFAERSFQGIELLRDKAIETLQPIEVGGLDAVEIVGKGIDVKSGAETFVYQLIVEPRHGGHFRLLGVAPESERAALLPEFRRMALSFRPVE